LRGHFFPVFEPRFITKSEVLFRIRFGLMSGDTVVIGIVNDTAFAVGGFEILFAFKALTGRFDTSWVVIAEVVPIVIGISRAGHDVRGLLINRHIMSPGQMDGAGKPKNSSTNDANAAFHKNGLFLWTRIKKG
jgi:hypothetical protein